MAKADAEPRRPEVHIEQAIGRLYRFLAGNRYTRFPWAVVQTFSKAEGSLLSGSMAYYTFLSLLPLLMVAAFVLATWVSATAQRTLNLGPTSSVISMIEELAGPASMLIVLLLLYRLLPARR